MIDLSRPYSEVGVRWRQLHHSQMIKSDDGMKMDQTPPDDDD
jgi:hypothetical protein